MRSVKVFFVTSIMILSIAVSAFSFENLDRMMERKAWQASATWGYQYLEDSNNNFIWQPETLTYIDTSTNKEVWVLVRQPDKQDIYSKEHGSNVWSHDGSRIGFFDQGNRKTANPVLYNDRGAMRWIVNADGSNLKAAEGYGKYNFPFDGFGWGNTELAYYAFGSNAVIDRPNSSLCKMTIDDNNVVSGSVILDTSGTNSYTKGFVKDGISTDDKRLVYRDFTPHSTSSCSKEASSGIYFTNLDGSLSVDGHWSVSRSMNDYAPEHIFEQRFHDVWAPGPSQEWIMGDYSGTSDIFAVFKLEGSCAEDKGPLYEPWDGDSFGESEEIKVVSDGGYNVQNPYNIPYFGHPVFDRWGRYSLLGTYTDNPLPGTRVWDSKTNALLPNYPLSRTYDGQHHTWNGWSDIVLGVDPTTLFIRANKWDQDSSESFDVVDTHHFGVMQANYNGYPRPSQSPDGTKVAFAAFWLNNSADNYPYINWAVVHYPHPPEITQASSSSNVVTIRFDWGLNRTTRGYTTRGWPNETLNDPPAPRETKVFRLWRSPNGTSDWKPITTVDARPFDKFDYANGGLKSGQVAYWEIMDTPEAGTWYYAITSVEHSGLESKTLSNVYRIQVGSNGSGVESASYPSDPGGVKSFYTRTPYSPALTYEKTSTSGHYQLTWTEPIDPMIRYYNIYYSTAATFEPVQQNRIASVPAGTTSYLDWAANPSADGSYLITSVDFQGNESVLGDEVPGTSAIPGVPGDVEVTDQAN